MFLLNKAFELRDKANRHEDEKPFLEHLEDLRTTITRIVVVLLVSTLACFSLKDRLMDLLRQPIVTVWEQSQAATLPETLTPETWELAKRTASFGEQLTEEERTVYFKQFGQEDLAFYASCTNYYRAAKSLETRELRLKFINELPNLSKRQQSFLKQLLDKKDGEPLANSKVDAKNNIVYMRSLKPTETFMLSLKLAFFAGIVIAFPLILYFTLQFVLPGLKSEERKALWPAMIVGFGLFLSGVFFCYFIVLPKALEFFYLYSSTMGVENEWRIGEYITFATQFTLIFGLAFELPVVVMTLVKLGLLDYDLMSRTRSYAIVSIFVIAAIITPTGDALTLSMLAVPMTFLYEMCIWFAYFTRKKELEEEANAQAEQPGDYQHRQDDYDKAYFHRDPDHQDSDEGEEFDDYSHEHAMLDEDDNYFGDDEHLDSQHEEDEESLNFLDELRQTYDPSKHGGVDEVDDAPQATDEETQGASDATPHEQDQDDPESSNDVDTAETQSPPLPDEIKKKQDDSEQH